MEESSNIHSFSTYSIDRAKSGINLRINKNFLPLSQKNTQNEDIVLIKKLYYNPFNEIECYKYFKQHVNQQKDIQQLNDLQPVQLQKESFPTDQLINSLQNTNLGAVITTQRQEGVADKQIIFTERSRRQSSLLLNSNRNEKQQQNVKQQICSRKPSTIIENFKNLNEVRFGSLNQQGISIILPSENEVQIQSQKNDNIKMKKQQTIPINNFLDTKKDAEIKGEKQAKTQLYKQMHRQYRRSENQISRMQQIKVEDMENYASMVKRKGTQETLAYKEIKDLTSFLKKQKSQTARFLRRTKKKKEEIEQNLKDGIVDEIIDSEKMKEKQALQYIIREQHNLARNPEEFKKMIRGTLRSNQITNLMDKLKIEKATNSAANIISKIKNSKGQPHHAHKYFSDLEKDANSLVQPLTILVEYASNFSEIDQPITKSKLSPKDSKLYFIKKREEQLNINDDLKIDFFKHIDPSQINRNKADTFYEIRSQAINISKVSYNKGNQIQPREKNKSFGQAIENLQSTSSEQKNLNIFKKDSLVESQYADQYPTQNTDRQHLLEDIYLKSRLNSEETQMIPQSKQIFKRKPLINGGIEYEFVNELGFKVRVQKPPTKQDYKEVKIHKAQKQEDLFFDKFVKKANRIGNEVEVRNRITDNSHKQQMKGYQYI